MLSQLSFFCAGRREGGSKSIPLVLFCEAGPQPARFMKAPYAGVGIRSKQSSDQHLYRSGPHQLVRAAIDPFELARARVVGVEEIKRGEILCPYDKERKVRSCALHFEHLN
jgi:hypothetical protein